MDVKQAVAAAKTHVQNLFSEEMPSNIGLEEVEFDRDEATWLVTVGFSRPWDVGTFASVSGVPPKRTYKIVTIRAHDGEVMSVKSRGPSPAF